MQTYGWIDMALKAGGLDQIGYALTEAPPCKFCCAAKALQESTPAGERNHPSPTVPERFELLLKTLTSCADHQKTSWEAPENFLSPTFRATPEPVKLRSRDGNGPPTPPPRNGQFS
ncbi:MAG: hypothetical protein MI807_19495 [Verrucomicrobiales bacterium]|nr:hypothetical protein [Verrucomicrobiales bacterium]